MGGWEEERDDGGSALRVGVGLAKAGAVRVGGWEEERDGGGPALASGLSGRSRGVAGGWVGEATRRRRASAGVGARLARAGVARVGGREGKRNDGE
ncbi:hypothetical protein GCM10018785_07400 [Streptomyces longispororuber]|uniref:Uncharacterized protein n=1 Tax=Streptomyces longispororuber TaxID=68230 RepID=A0A918Z8I0_9ACTN|nr:hypothetical protein GCM10018785_07400 [Streptomyces longispororuber]